jgi:hypothetical protein
MEGRKGLEVLVFQGFFGLLDPAWTGPTPGVVVPQGIDLGAYLRQFRQSGVFRREMGNFRDN